MLSIQIRQKKPLALNKIKPIQATEGPLGALYSMIQACWCQIALGYMNDKNQNKLADAAPG